MKRPHFLIIDDERNFREFLGEALEVEGYTVSIAATGRAGLAMANEQAPYVVLLDQNLPDGSGLDLIPELRLLPSNPVVVVITAYAEYARAVSAVKTGASHYLTKPFGFPELLAVIAETCVTFPAEPGSTEPDTLAAIIGCDPQMRTLKSNIARIARTPVGTVLIRGESGTGKELVAQAIHGMSERASRRLVSVNCSALTETLLMDELFGHERGAFTDARAQKLGVFELAHRGSLLLDEVGDMDARAQAALLRVLETRRVTRVGGTEEIPVDVRVIAATNCDLEQAVTNGQFRADLYYRLNVVSVTVPPLRERRRDIVPLLRHFGRVIAGRYMEPERDFAPAVEAMLTSYTWPGNVRELRNLVERVYAAGSRPVIGVDDMPVEFRGAWGTPTIPASSAEGTSETSREAATTLDTLPVECGSPRRFRDLKREIVDGFERTYLEAALRQTGGNITVAAEEAGILRQVFQRMMVRHGLSGEQFRAHT